jgi:hypothetical protein
VTLTSPRHDPIALSAPAGADPAGGDVRLTELIVLPGRERPRLLVPGERRGAASAVKRYGEGGSLTARLGKRAISIAIVSGAGSRLFGDRLRVAAADGVPTIASYLAAALGCEIRLSIHLGAARANRKPVLQLLSADGEAIAWAKIGIDELTRQLVRAERDALVQLAGSTLTALTVPPVLHHGSWNDLEVLVLGPLPVWRGRRPLSASRLSAAMREVAAVGALSSQPLAATAHWQRLGRRLSAVADGPARAALSVALDRLADQAGDTVLCYGAAHGDWTPWNMASTAGSLLVWDWERFAHGVPIGFDALHHRLFSAVLPPRRDPARAAHALIEQAPALLERFDLGPAQARVTAALYLGDLAVRHLADRQAEAGAALGDPGEWLIPAISGALAAR